MFLKKPVTCFNLEGHHHQAEMVCNVKGRQLVLFGCFIVLIGTEFNDVSEVRRAFICRVKQSWRICTWTDYHLLLLTNLDD